MNQKAILKAGNFDKDFILHAVIPKQLGFLILVVLEDE